MFRNSLKRVARAPSVVLIMILLKSIDFGLRRTRYKQVCFWLLKLSPEPKSTRIDMRRARSIARTVNMVAIKRTARATCLRRSLALWWILRWCGIPSQIQIAFGTSGGHAWVEHHGHVINDRHDVQLRYMVKFSGELSPEKVATIS